MNRIIFQIRSLWSAIERVSKIKLVRVLVNILAFGFIGYLLVKNYSYFTVLIQNRTITYHYFVWAFIVIIVVVIFIGGTSWQLINLGLGQKISWPDALRIQMFSNVTKYIPGTIWQYASKATLSSRLGIGAKAFSMAIAMELGQTLWIGFCLVLLFIPDRLGGINISQLIRLSGLIAGFIGIVLSFSFPFWGRSVLSKFPGQMLAINPIYLSLSSSLILIGWILSVFSFWLISLGLETSEITSIPIYFFTYAVSLVGGILVIPVPNGLGVREGLMVIALQNNLPEALSIILAGISRIVIILAEALGFTIVWIVLRVKKIPISHEKQENEQSNP